MRRELSNPASFESCPTDEKFPPEEGAGGQNNRLRLKNCPGSCVDSRDFRILKEEKVCKIGVNI